jgi:hypothetical protein
MMTMLINICSYVSNSTRLAAKATRSETSDSVPPSLHQKVNKICIFLFSIIHYHTKYESPTLSSASIAATSGGRTNVIHGAAEKRAIIKTIIIKNTVFTKL